uniref:Uncharacterized protein n=1 Tax=Davidia involucrata TaxID=16924 RepID=A0A5B7B9W9_DAVIN
MQSSDQLPSRRSFVSYGEESRIDSELRYLAGGDFGEVEMWKEVVIENKEAANVASGKDWSRNKKFEKIRRTQSASAKFISSAQSNKASHLQLESDASTKSSPRSKSFHKRPPTGKRIERARED